MSTDDSITQANPGSGEPSEMSFRERKEQSLREELEPSQTESDDTSSTPDQETEEGERQPDSTMLDESDEDQTESSDTEEATDEDSDEDQPYSDREQQLQERADKAEEMRKSMEVDYRHKTHKLSESAREVKARLAEVDATIHYFAAETEKQLAQFNNVDWASLRTNPEQFQQAQQAYMQANQAHQQRQSELARIKTRREEIEAESRAHIAEQSKGVLTHQIPDWGDEVYASLRSFAQKEYDYSPDEFDQIVDWRPIKMMHDAMQASSIKKKSAKVLRSVGKKQGSKAPLASSSRPMNRNAQGQFIKAQEELRQNPGDKNRFREMKRTQLEAERERKRR